MTVTLNILCLPVK